MAVLPPMTKQQISYYLITCNFLEVVDSPTFIIALYIPLFKFEISMLKESKSD